MKYSIGIKFIAILLAACALVTVAASAFGIALLSVFGLYNADDYARWQENERSQLALRLAQEVADNFAMELLSDCPQSLWDGWSRAKYVSIESWLGLKEGSWHYELSHTDGELLDTGGTPGLEGDSMPFTVQSNYLLQCSPQEGDFAMDDIWAKVMDGPYYQVNVTLTQDAVAFYDGLATEYIHWLFAMRYWLIVLLVAGLLVFAVCAVYLCLAAGRSRAGAELSPGGLNRLPLDVYFLGAGSLCAGLLALTVEVLESWVANERYNPGAIALMLLGLLAAAVIFVGFCFAVAAQVKLRRGYWWRNSLVGRCLGLLWRGLRWLLRAGGKLFALLPQMWRYLLIGLAMGFFPLFFFFLAVVGRSFWMLPLLASCLLDLAIICYGGYAYGTLLSGARRMAQGDLNAQISTQYLLGSYRQCAEHLNTLADVATVAAKKQLKSERMKTELITNVSHDIKTPLTSIISYVDLLEKPHSPEEGTEYIRVLGRQSQRLKKLVEDLMEMSKATTGNMAVAPERLDAVEAVSQALGEFADKLALAKLTPVFSHQAPTMPMLADGKLTWRVLSNLLSNAVKYALPGTRVYVDLVQQPGQVRISLKNISREELNVSADELTERFVRGDASRNTEGSGLGLNIAKSLMELQKGTLELTVDGDLFKVTLAFPAC